MLLNEQFPIRGDGTTKYPRRVGQGRTVVGEGGSGWHAAVHFPSFLPTGRLRGNSKSKGEYAKF